MTRYVRRALEVAGWLVVILLSCLMLPACPKPGPGPGPGQPPGPVNCGVLDILASCGPQVVPLVNECLSSQGDSVACILSITKVVGCATYELLSCVVRDQGDRAMAAYKANPLDTRDHWRAQRAQEFLTKVGATFTP